MVEKRGFIISRKGYKIPRGSPLLLCQPPNLPAMSASTPASTTAKLTFLIQPENGVRAFQTINANPETGERERNFSREEKDVVLENLRGKENSTTLDTAGFQLYTRASKHNAFVDDDEIQREYYPESEELIKELTGASRVVFFDHSTSTQHTSFLRF